MRLPYLVFAALGVVLLADLGLTVPSLAEPVATHFDGAGIPNGWMTREAYVIFMAGFGIGLPLLVVGVPRLLPRWFPKRTKIPNRAYWLAPERRAETQQFLNWHMAWLGNLMVLFAFAIHHLVVMANASRPPRLPHAPLFFIIGCFLAGITVWTVLMWYRFRRRG